jgi:hypothetical protein
MSLPKIKIVDLSEIESIDSLLSLIREEDDIILQDHGVEVGTLFPKRAPRHIYAPKPSAEALSRARAAAGAWAGLGADDLLDEIYRGRNAELDAERSRRIFPEE